MRGQHGWLLRAPLRRERDGVTTHEISLNPAYLRQREPRAVVSTLVHEMAHYWRLCRYRHNCQDLGPRWRRRDVDQDHGVDRRAQLAHRGRPGTDRIRLRFWAHGVTRVESGSPATPRGGWPARAGPSAT
jgi:hypothetical protein